MMKAWLVREKDEFCATVVFGETRNKAKSLALTTDTCEDVAYIDIEAHRVPNLDKYYNGKSELDWLDPDDRLVLVKEGGFRCEEVFEVECENCSAKEYCGEYEVLKDNER